MVSTNVPKLAASWSAKFCGHISCVLELSLPSLSLWLQYQKTSQIVRDVLRCGPGSKMVGFLSTQYPFLYTDKIQPSSSTCNLIFFRPFVSANPNPNVVVSEPDKVKISASPSADIARWSNRCIGFWQPLSSTHWLDNVKRVVSIYTRHPSTRLILFIFDCVLEQLWLTWSTNSKLQNIFLEETQPEQTNPSNLVNITSELSSFRSTYSPLATRYNHKTSPFPQIKKQTSRQTSWPRPARSNPSSAT